MNPSPHSSVVGAEEGVTIEVGTGGSVGTNVGNTVVGALVGIRVEVGIGVGYGTGVQLGSLCLGSLQ